MIIVVDVLIENKSVMAEHEKDMQLHTLFQGLQCAINGGR